jgi:hypothetical protein
MAQRRGPSVTRSSQVTHGRGLLSWLPSLVHPVLRQPRHRPVVRRFGRDTSPRWRVGDTRDAIAGDVNPATLAVGRGGVGTAAVIDFARNVGQGAVPTTLTGLADRALSDRGLSRLGRRHRVEPGGPQQPTRRAGSGGVPRGHRQPERSISHGIHLLGSTTGKLDRLAEVSIKCTGAREDVSGRRCRVAGGVRTN